MKKHYKLYCTRIGYLELRVDEELFFSIVVNYLLRSCSLTNVWNNEEYQVFLKGWFFTEKLVCNFKYKSFIFRRNKLHSSGNSIEYCQRLGEPLIVVLSNQVIKLSETQNMKSLEWSGNFSEKEVFLITCIALCKYVLKSPHRSFEHISSKNFKSI